MNYKNIIIVIFIFLGILTPLSSASNPAWYSIAVQELTVGGNVYNNTVDIWSSNLLNIQFAQVVSGLNSAPNAGYENLRLEVLVPNGPLRFVKLDDPTKWVTYQISIQHGQQISVNPVIFPYILPIAPGAIGTTATTLFSMNINTLPPNSGQQWRGTYHTPFQIRVLDADGVVLSERTLALYVYFRRSGVSAPLTLLTLERYTAADNIVVPWPYNPNTAQLINVGAVNFLSNEAQHAYSVRFYPGGANASSSFELIHTTQPNSRIQFEVNLPNRSTTDYLQSFTTPLLYTTTDANGNWQERIEIAIRDVNYNNAMVRSGSYKSIVMVELIIN